MALGVGSLVQMMVVTIGALRPLSSRLRSFVSNPTHTVGGPQPGQERGFRLAKPPRLCALGTRVSRLLPLSSKLTEETPVIGPHPLLDEPEDVYQVPDYRLAVRR